MLGTRWERVLANVRAFVAVRDAHAAAGGNRCRVTFQLTFLETNVPELADIVHLAVEPRRRPREGAPPLGPLRAIRPFSMRRSPSRSADGTPPCWRRASAAAERPLPEAARLLENIFLLDARRDGGPGARGPCPFLGRRRG